MSKKHHLRNLVIILLVVITVGTVYNFSPVKSYIHSITTTHNSLAAIAEYNLYLTQNKADTDISEARLRICHRCPLFSNALGGMCNSRLW